MQILYYLTDNVVIVFIKNTTDSFYNLYTTYLVRIGIGLAGIISWGWKLASSLEAIFCNLIEFLLLLPALNSKFVGCWDLLQKQLLMNYSNNENWLFTITVTLSLSLFFLSAVEIHCPYFNLFLKFQTFHLGCLVFVKHLCEMHLLTFVKYVASGLILP